MAWTNDDIKKLKQLWQKGLSTVAIGQALGMSKNAVIGKVHRLQLQARPSPIVAVKPATSRKKAPAKKPGLKVVKPIMKPITRKPMAKKVVKSKAPAPKKAKPTVVKKTVAKPVKKTPVVKAAPKKAPVKKPAPVVQIKARPAVKPAPAAPKAGKKPVLIPQSRRELFTKKTSQVKHKGVPLVELKTTSCRWPLGDPNDPDFSFCGKEAVPGKPYCATHCLEAYTGVFKPR